MLNIRFEDTIYHQLLTLARKKNISIPNLVCCILQDWFEKNSDLDVRR